MKERFRWLAAAIAAHPDRKVVGPLAASKGNQALTALKVPTKYSYTLHFYGPYSEGLHAEIGLLESLGLVEEEAQVLGEAFPTTSLAQAGSVAPGDQTVPSGHRQDGRRRCRGAGIGGNL